MPRLARNRLQMLTPNYLRSANALQFDPAPNTSLGQDLFHYNISIAGPTCSLDDQWPGPDDQVTCSARNVMGEGLLQGFVRLKVKPREHFTVMDQLTSLHPFQPAITQTSLMTFPLTLQFSYLLSACMFSNNYRWFIIWRNRE